MTTGIYQQMPNLHSLPTTYPDITSTNVGDVLKSVRQVDSPYMISHSEIRIRGNVTI